MGMFINFPDDEEGFGFKIDSTLSKTQPYVMQNDIICSDVDNSGKLFDEALVTKIDGDKIMVIFIDGRDDGAIVEWGNPDYLKVCAVTYER